MARLSLAAFRNADARSLARALVLIFVFGTFFDAFHSGSMANTLGNPGVICTVNVGSEGANSEQSRRSAGLSGSCCLLGCTGMHVATAASTDTVLVVNWPEAAKPPARVSFTLALNRPANFRPRGPPVLT
jgi:hypothetical protein